jgi:DNA-directed RNA polymerase subunit K/omega
MIYPSIDDLTRNGTYNRYELVIATAKAARMITDIETSKKEEMEKNAAKESSSDKTLYPRTEIIVSDEKAVKVAIQKIHNGEFLINKNIVF